MPERNAMKTCLLLGFILAASSQVMGTASAPPLPPVTGTIASNRLGEEQVGFLKTATQTEAISVLITPEPSDPGHFARWDSIQNRKFTQTLAALLLSDKTYASASDFHDAYGNSQNFLPKFTFYVRSSAVYSPYIVVDIDPTAQELRVMAPFAKREHHPTELYANYTLVAPQLTALIKEAFPSSPQAQAVKTWSAYKRSVPVSIPAAVQAQIATLQPGMTRAGVLKLFGTEGGLSSRTWRTYVWKGVSVGNQLIKVDVEFMPKEAHIQWINGAGILIDPMELYRFGNGGEDASDIIVRISLPYLAYPVTD